MLRNAKEKMDEIGITEKISNELWTREFDTQLSFHSISRFLQQINEFKAE
jgi:hypothetical protein